VIVVDNDVNRSAEPVIQEARQKGLAVQYHVEPVRSIALARTRSVRSAQGNWIAFIDDDEAADPLWVLELWKQTEAGLVDAVFGTVEYSFEPGAPAWICSAYPSNKRVTGEKVQHWEGTTANALVRRSAIIALGDLFSADYGLTGCEDSELFRRLSDRGSSFVGAAAAITYEKIPAHRTTVRYLLRWWLTAGAATDRIYFSNVSAWKLKGSLLRRAWLIGAYIFTGAGCFPFSRRFGLRFLLKAAFESGLIWSRLTGASIQRY
jgi:succinoglycan biosynthesis protein ExoM